MQRFVPYRHLFRWPFRTVREDVDNLAKQVVRGNFMNSPTEDAALAYMIDATQIYYTSKEIAFASPSISNAINISAIVRPVKG